MILGLCGYAGVGKDTLAQQLIDHHGYIRVGFADKLRDLAIALDPIVTTTTSPGLHEQMVGAYDGWERLVGVVKQTGWDRAKRELPEVRELLQRLGVGVRDILGPDTWVRAALDGLDPELDYVVTDVRFPNEAAAVRSRGGLLVRIHRPGFGPINGHQSETALDHVRADSYIVNDRDTADLRDAADLLAAL